MLPFIENSAREEKVFYSRAEYFLLAVRKYSVRGHNFFCMDCSLKMSGLFFRFFTSDFLWSCVSKMRTVKHARWQKCNRIERYVFTLSVFGSCLRESARGIGRKSARGGTAASRINVLCITVLTD